MSNFWRDNPDMSVLIHDSNSSIGIIRDVKEAMRYRFNNLKIEDEKLNYHLETIERQCSRLVAVIDSFYEKQKEKFNQK